MAATLLGLVPGVGGAVAFAADPVPVLLGAWRVNFTPSRMNGWGANIRRPAQILDGKVIQPGARFNYARLTGPYTVENGYRSGAAIVNGRLKMDGVIGGGLCSNVTAMFNAAARAGLEINQRYNHTWYISRYPVGLDATVWVDEETYSGKNMIFTNDTGHPITIRGFWDRRWVRMEVWGVNDGRTATFSEPNITNRVPWTRIVTYYSDNVAAGNRRVITSPGDGFDSMVTRTVKAADGTVLWKNDYFSHYKRQTGVALLGRYPGDPEAGTVAYVTQ